MLLGVRAHTCEIHWASIHSEVQWWFGLIKVQAPTFSDTKYNYCQKISFKWMIEIIMTVKGNNTSYKTDLRQINFQKYALNQRPREI